ncbi:hypothetical protein O3P69_010330 [Scylla paramamosain]|uniref:Uncharacterized protein n=1 Tax=Scylla paramamosain TaxID=85552 RepID=A0AAW0TTS9_SCYPA
MNGGEGRELVSCGACLVCSISLTFKQVLDYSDTHTGYSPIYVPRVITLRPRKVPLRLVATGPLLTSAMGPLNAGWPQRGHSRSKISELLKVTEQLVRTVRRELISSNYDCEGAAERKHHSRRSDTVRDAEFVTQLRAMVDEDPSRSMRSIARELQVSEGTMQEDRFKKSKMLNKLKFPLENDMLWFFSDEKNFCKDQTHNSQNNRLSVPRMCQEA